MNVDILAFGAHPDDVELSAGGTIAKLVEQGLDVGIVDLTRGQMGSRGTPELRKEEAQRSSEILGLKARENLGFDDTQLVNDRRHQLPIIEQVRKYRPHICLIGAPYDRHPDHGNATGLVLDALFYAGLPKIRTNQEHWRPSHIIHYMQDRPFEPDFVFDISATFETKKEAILAFSSQFNVDDPGEEPETYISSVNFFKQVEARARYFGHLAGFEFGEPFKYYQKPVPLSSLNTFLETNPKR